MVSLGRPHSQGSDIIFPLLSNSTVWPVCKKLMLLIKASNSVGRNSKDMAPLFFIQFYNYVTNKSIIQDKRHSHSNYPIVSAFGILIGADTFSPVRTCLVGCFGILIPVLQLK